MSVGCTRLLLATGPPPDPFAVLRGHSPTDTEAGLIRALRVRRIVALSRSAMHVLQTLVRVRQLASSPRKAQGRGGGNGSTGWLFLFGSAASAAAPENLKLVILPLLE